MAKKTKPAVPTSLTEAELDDRHQRDPFLIAHRTGNRGFEFSMAGKYSPAAVRDQLTRSTAIIERAFACGVLTETSGLLIKGCGAAAVNAAMTAVKLGVGHVTLSVDGPFFSRQRTSLRKIDPVEYDWPAEGWERGSVPNERVPLLYPRGIARDVACTFWENLWTSFCETYPGAISTVPRNPPPDQSAFDVVFDCTGPGEEITTVRPSYRWFDFWEIDPFEKPDPGTTPEILVSGGGDGALQDFLRILYPNGKTPRDIYDGFGLTKDQRLQIEWRILNAEDRSRRAWVWGSAGNPAMDTAVLSKLHEDHRKVALDVLPAVRTALKAQLPVATISRLWLAHSERHFSPCYAFNRFLVILIDEYCKSTPGIGTRLLAGRKLKTVESAEPAPGHVCASDPADCYGHRHRVTYEGEQDGPSEFDIVVVRHGVNHARKARLSRQALPYELP